MKLSWILTIIGAAIGLGLMLLVGQAVIRPDVDLIVAARMQDERITPDADGQNDITIFRYELSRNARVTLGFVSQQNPDLTFVFRDDEPRAAGQYQVPFSGVVNGYTLPDESFDGMRIERRLMPAGLYQWRFHAESDTESQTIEGTLDIADASAELPLITTFSVAPDRFTPNQDGIDDRVEINAYLEKDADFTVYLLDASDRRIPVVERSEGRLPGEAGRHVFDYEGGIDLGADPPPDGEYRVIAEAQDTVGQRISRQTSLTIADGGKPRAEIAPQAVGVDVAFSVQPYEEQYATSLDTRGNRLDLPAEPGSRGSNLISMALGDMLVFRLTVENYSNVPIRTTGPMPGTVYEQTQSYSSIGEYKSPGAWRVGIRCETSTIDFPYRWAVGSAADLVEQIDPRTGETFLYLPANSQSVVWGAIHMTDLIERQNPQNCWAGLIQEEVEVSLRNAYVGARQIELIDPDASAVRDDS